MEEERCIREATSEDGGRKSIGVDEDDMYISITTTHLECKIKHPHLVLSSLDDSRCK